MPEFVTQIPESVWMQYGALLIALGWTAFLLKSHRDEQREERSAVREERAVMLNVIEGNTKAMSANTEAIVKMESTLDRLVIRREN